MGLVAEDSFRLVLAKKIDKLSLTESFEQWQKCVNNVQLSAEIQSLKVIDKPDISDFIYDKNSENPAPYVVGLISGSVKKNKKIKQFKDLVSGKNARRPNKLYFGTGVDNDNHFRYLFHFYLRDFPLLERDYLKKRLKGDSFDWVL